MRIVLALLGATLLLTGSARAAAAQAGTKRVISLAAADRIAAAAEAEARKRGSTVVIVVVDDGGYPIVLRRLDDTQVASVEVGIGKARTAAIFRRPSGAFEQQIKDGRLASLVLPGATPLQGGVPITFEGKVIGAIGVSGNTPREDEEIALAGAAVAGAALAGSP
jgi:glc operon protein GlcG